MSDLGEYKGLPIAGHALALKNAGEGLSKAMRVSPTDLEPGEEIHLLVRAKAGNVMMRIDDIDAPTNWTVEQSLTAQTITIVSRDFADDKIAAQLLAEQKLKDAENRKKGIHSFPFPPAVDKGDVVHTDESGVVLTDAEYADRVGAGLPVLNVAPAIVVYPGENNRAMWPDEFPKGMGCPQVGDVLPDGEVVKLLDATTGEPIEGHTEGGGPDELTTDGEDGSSADLAKGADDSPATDDDFETPDPATAARIAAADVDPAIVDFLAGGTAEVKLRVKGQVSLQLLRQALDVELRTPNTPRQGVVTALEARIAELDS